MAMHDVDDLPQAPWGVTAAYLYTLDLDRPALAWEYLRRNPKYGADYAAATRRRSAWCERWGLRVVEDPRLDAREAHPHWLSSADELLHVRVSRSHGAADRFDLWGIPGRKRITIGDAELTLTVELSALRLRASLAGNLADGASYACVVPLTLALRGQLEAFNVQAQALKGHAPQIDPARPVTRAALLHLRVLQALDAAQAGASHRDIAQALFGLEAVVLRWHEDGELRAQVRHLLRRAEAYIAGGYLELASVRQAAAKHPGDEPVR